MSILLKDFWGEYCVKTSCVMEQSAEYLLDLIWNEKLPRNVSAISSSLVVWQSLLWDTSYMQSSSRLFWNICCVVVVIASLVPRTKVCWTSFGLVNFCQGWSCVSCLRTQFLVLLEELYVEKEVRSMFSQLSWTDCFSGQNFTIYKVVLSRSWQLVNVKCVCQTL